MIDFSRHTLKNGLRVLLHQDNSSPIMALNVLYDVGARDEDPAQTGFAHLFEHLMFGGSVNIPEFDRVLESVGGQNNAFTSNDITNYYITVPKSNIETALWLESDRMLSLAFSEKSLEVQRQVVIEEFKQNYLNQPYGDTSFLIRKLAYKTHPYQWPTIGKDLSHIEEAKMEDVKAFFSKFYAPNNAVLCLSGDFDLDEMKAQIERYFGSIPSQIIPTRNLNSEPKQTEARLLEVEREVPNDTLYKAYRMAGKYDSDFQASDILSDLLSQGKSSILYQKLIKEQGIFIDISSYVGGSYDPGLFYIVGRPKAGIDLKTADLALENVLQEFINQPVDIKALEKIKNKFEVAERYNQLSVLNKAMALCEAELSGDADRVNTQLEDYRNVSPDQVLSVAKQILNPTQCSTLYYRAKT
ncbi:MAG: M16 family metallopeptidase [Flavobacteriales bacterium]